jgi:hypothetical protein
MAHSVKSIEDIVSAFRFLWCGGSARVPMSSCYASSARRVEDHHLSLKLLHRSVCVRVEERGEETRTANENRTKSCDDRHLVFLCNFVGRVHVRSSGSIDHVPTFECGGASSREHTSARSQFRCCVTALFLQMHNFFLYEC